MFVAVGGFYFFLEINEKVMSRRYEKLKTNLKLAIQRLKLLEKKKSENTKKSTKEIADYIVASKWFSFLLLLLLLLFSFD